MSVTRRNNVKVGGRGTRPMILGHGFGCDQHMWRWVTPAFQDSHRLVLFDHVGAGQSDLAVDDRRKYGTHEGYADDLVGPSPRYIDDEGCLGGFTRAEIDQLLHALESNHLAWVAAMAPVIVGAQDTPEPAQELADGFCHTDPVIARDFARVTVLSDNRADLARVTTPTLIRQCRDDAIAPLPVGDCVRRQIAGSHLEVLAAIGHCPHMSAPLETVAAIKSYLARQQAPPCP